MGKKEHHFHLVIRGKMPSKEAERFAKELMRKIEMVKKKYYPDTTVKLGRIM